MNAYVEIKANFLTKKNLFWLEFRKTQLFLIFERNTKKISAQNASYWDFLSKNAKKC